LPYGPTFGPITMTDPDSYWVWIPGRQPAVALAEGTAYGFNTRVVTHDVGTYMEAPGAGPNEYPRYFCHVRNERSPNSATFVVKFYAFP